MQLFKTNLWAAVTVAIHTLPNHVKPAVIRVRWVPPNCIQAYLSPWALEEVSQGVRHTTGKYVACYFLEVYSYVYMFQPGEVMRCLVSACFTLTVGIQLCEPTWAPQLGEETSRVLKDFAIPWDQGDSCSSSYVILTIVYRNNPWVM